MSATWMSRLRGLCCHPGSSESSRAIRWRTVFSCTPSRSAMTATTPCLSRQISAVWRRSQTAPGWDRAAHGRGPARRSSRHQRRRRPLPGQLAESAHSSVRDFVTLSPGATLRCMHRRYLRRTRPLPTRHETRAGAAARAVVPAPHSRDARSGSVDAVITKIPDNQGLFWRRRRDLNPRSP